jgi:hypothetical protein
MKNEKPELSWQEARAKAKWLFLLYLTFFVF